MGDPVTVTGSDVTAGLAYNEPLAELNYEVQYRLRHAPSNLWAGGYTGPLNECVISDLEQGEEVSVRVRAVTNTGVKGQWTQLDGIVLGKDTTPPPVPSKPTVKGDLGVVIVGWDGLGASGEGMPDDFKYCEIGVAKLPDSAPDGPTHPFLYRNLLSTPIEEGSFDYPIWVYLRTVDYTGNVSDWSAPEVCELKHLVDKEAIQKLINSMLVTRSEERAPTTDPADNGAQVGMVWWQRDPGSKRPVAAWRWDGTNWETEDFSNATFGRVDVADLVASDANITSVVAQKVAAAAGQFIEIDADQIRANSITAESAIIGRLKTYILDVEWLRGKTIQGVTIQGSTVISTTYQSTENPWSGFYASGNTVRICNSSGSKMFEADASGLTIRGRYDSGYPGYPGVTILPHTGYGDTGVFMVASTGTASSTDAGVWSNPSGSGDLYLRGKQGSYSPEYNGKVVIASGSQFAIQSPAVAGSSRVPNLCIGYDSVVGEIGSTSRIKENIGDLDGALVKAHRVLDAVPVRQFNDAAEMRMWRAAGSPPTQHPTTIPGVIAEEVLAAGLDEFVLWQPDPDAEGPQVPWETGHSPVRRVQGVMYDRLGLLAFPLIKELYAKIETLENRIAALENNAGA